MHTLHDYVAKQLADKIKERRVVVWYDERREFQPFVDEVRGDRVRLPVVAADDDPPCLGRLRTRHRSHQEQPRGRSAARSARR